MFPINKFCFQVEKQIDLTILLRIPLLISDLKKVSISLLGFSAKYLKHSLEIKRVQFIDEKLALNFNLLNSNILVQQVIKERNVFPPLLMIYVTPFFPGKRVY